jgi:hypothetical protein
MNMEPVSDRSALASALSEAFPQVRSMVDELVSQIAEYGGFSEYRLLSDVFRWGVLEAAVMGGEEEALRAAYGFIERLLSSPDQAVREPTEIRVVPYMLKDPHWREVTLRYAGPLLGGALDRHTGNQDWRADRD